MGLSLVDALACAHSKAAGLYPPDLRWRLCTATVKDWELVRWIAPPVVETYLAELVALGEGLILVD